MPGCWITDITCPATTIVPILGFTRELGAADTVIAPFPEPELAEVIDRKLGSLLVALQAHPAAATTLIVAVPPLPAILGADGVALYPHGSFPTNPCDESVECPPLDF